MYKVIRPAPQAVNIFTNNLDERNVYAVKRGNLLLPIIREYNNRWSPLFVNDCPYTTEVGAETLKECVVSLIDDNNEVFQFEDFTEFMEESLKLIKE